MAFFALLTSVSATLGQDYHLQTMAISTSERVIAARGFWSTSTYERVSIHWDAIDARLEEVFLQEGLSQIIASHGSGRKGAFWPSMHPWSVPSVSHKPWSNVGVGLFIGLLLLAGIFDFLRGSNKKNVDDSEEYQEGLAQQQEGLAQQQQELAQQQQGLAQQQQELAQQQEGLAQQQQELAQQQQELAQVASQKEPEEGDRLEGGDQLAEGDESDAGNQSSEGDPSAEGKPNKAMETLVLEAPPGPEEEIVQEEGASSLVPDLENPLPGTASSPTPPAHSSASKKESEVFSSSSQSAEELEALKDASSQPEETVEDQQTSNPSESVEPASGTHATDMPGAEKNERKEEDVVRFILLERLYKRFQEEQAAFDAEGYKEDQKRIKAAREIYMRWRAYLLQLGGFEWENSIRSKFRDILDEEPTLVQDRRILVYPLNPRTEQNDLRALAKSIDQLLDEQGGDVMARLPKVIVRKPSEVDYRLDESKVPLDTLALLRQQLVTLTLIQKNLDKAYRELSQLTTWMLSNEANLHVPLQTLDSLLSELVAKIMGDQPFDEDMFIAIEQYIQESTTEKLRSNTGVANTMTTLAKDLEKKYFEFLRKNIFRTINDMYNIKRQYLDLSEEQTVQNRDFLERWGALHDRLIKLFLKEICETKLHISPLGCERGDMYNADIHDPYGPSEVDKMLGNNQIKSVVNMGFAWDNGRERRVIKPADVIVVRNAP